jgi:two-component system, NarL family, nitrate/nitrite response regulator NarL
VTLLDGPSGVEAAGQSETRADLAAAVEAAGADVVAWDVGPLPRGGFDRLRDLASRDVPILAVLWTEEQAAEALAAGARGLLLRDTDAEPLAAALRGLARGLVVLDPALAPALLRPRLAPPEAPVETLTPREVEVLQLLSQGLSNRGIAGRLGISDHTAKFHVTAILGKLGAGSRAEAVVQAVRLGLVVL